MTHRFLGRADFIGVITLDKPKYDGVAVYMDGREWIVPALSLRQFREHYVNLFLDPKVTPENYHEFLIARIPVILAALQRNYPDVTEEQLLDMIDLRTFIMLMGAIQDRSGLRPAPPGEERPVAPR